MTTTFLIVVQTSNGFGEFGWDALVAIGTLALALFTVWLAYSTRQLAMETADDVAADFRPVLIDAAEGNLRIAYPELPAPPGNVRVAVKNVGGGPAMNTKASLIVRFGDDDWRMDGIDLGTIGPDMPGEQTIAGIPVFHAGRSMTAELRCVYEDLAEATHRSQFFYELNTGSDEAVAFPQLALPLLRTQIPRPADRRGRN